MGLDKEQVEEEESEYEVDPEEEKEKLNLIEENTRMEEIIDGEEKDEKQNDQINIKGGEENTDTKNEKEDLAVNNNDIDDENKMNEEGKPEEAEEEEKKGQVDESKNPSNEQSDGESLHSIIKQTKLKNMYLVKWNGLGYLES